ncbi:MAG: shikimate dehydrogenase [Gallionella sp.]
MKDKYAVIGNPINHSKSPLIHKMFAQQTGQDISYEAILSPLDGFAVTVERLRWKGYKGCNVTVPFKFEAFLLATNRSERAEASRVVNTLEFNGDEIFGDNTDGVGLVTDLKGNLNLKFSDKQVLLVGAGGAALGVLSPLLMETPRCLVISNRTMTKAEEAVKIFHYRVGKHPSNSTEFVAKSFSELTGENFDLVINATSAGLTDSALSLPTTLFAPGALAYDMMYGRETPFMKFAREHGAQVADGLGMLVEQAAESFNIWRGVRPDTAPVIEAMRKRP